MELPERQRFGGFFFVLITPGELIGYAAVHPSARQAIAAKVCRLGLQRNDPAQVELAGHAHTLFGFAARTRIGTGSLF
jgi:hypothetical protein